MKVSIEIDQTLTCAVEILAVPGDRLMVLNGTVIGIMPQQPEEPEAVEQSEQINGYYTLAQIYCLFRTHGPTTVRNLNNKLSHGPEMRICVKRAVEHLLKEGRLVKLNDTRFGVYAVPPTN